MWQGRMYAHCYEILNIGTTLLGASTDQSCNPYQHIRERLRYAGSQRKPDTGPSVFVSSEDIHTIANSANSHCTTVSVYCNFIVSEVATTQYSVKRQVRHIRGIFRLNHKHFPFSKEGRSHDTFLDSAICEEMLPSAGTAHSPLSLSTITSCRTQ